MKRYITFGAILSAYFYCLHTLEVNNEKRKQNEADAIIMESYGRASTSPEVQEAYNRQCPIFDHETNIDENEGKNQRYMDTIFKH